MCNVEGRKETPAPVDLGVVLVELGDDQEDSAQCYRNSESEYQRVRLSVEVQEPLAALHNIDDLGRKLVQLWNVRLDCLGPAGTVFEPK